LWEHHFGEDPFPNGNFFSKVYNLFSDIDMGGNINVNVAAPAASIIFDMLPQFLMTTIRVDVIIL
jgi:hypothetical protein